MMFIRLVLVFLLLSAEIFAADAVLIYDKIFPNLSVARHVEPILDQSGQLEGFVVSDAATKSLRLMWVDGRPEDTISLPHIPHKSINYQGMDSLFIYVIASTCDPTSFCWWESRLIRIAFADRHAEMTEVVPPFYLGIYAEDYEDNFPVYEDIRFLRDSSRQPTSVIMENSVYWQGYIFTIGPYSAVKGNGLWYSLDLSEIRFRTPNQRLIPGNFTNSTARQWAAFSQIDNFHSAWCDLCGDTQYRGVEFALLDSVGSRLALYFREWARFSAFFAGDFNMSSPGDEIILLGNLPVIEQDLPDDDYRACYSFVGGVASRLWFHPLESAFSHWTFLARHYFQPRNILILTQRSTAYFLDCGTGTITDSAIATKPLDWSTVYQSGEWGETLEMLTRRADTLFVYRFDAITDADDDPDPSLPDGFSLSQNYPNPFNASTEIRFSLPRSSEITLTIFNLLGQEVNTVLSGRQTAGEHRVTWDGRDNLGHDCASGIYFYRFSTDGFSFGKKMLLLK